MRPLATTGILLGMVLWATPGKCAKWIEVNVYTDCGWAQSDCPQSGVNPCLAGACAFLRISVLNLPTGVDSVEDNLDEWPRGLRIFAGTYEDDIWNEVPGFAEQMSLRRWTRYGLRNQWRNDPNSPDRFWVIQFTVPPDRIGQTIFFRFEYDIPGHGVHPNSPKEGSGKVLLTVVAPCSKADSDRIAGSFVCAACAEGDYNRAIFLADSLIPLGWRDLAGLESASGAAFQIDSTEKGLQFFDLNYEANGRTMTFGKKLSPESERQLYLQRRARIVEQINQQQQR